MCVCVCVYFKKYVKELYSFTANTHTHIFQIVLVSVGVDACATVLVWGLKGSSKESVFSLCPYLDSRLELRLPGSHGGFFTH